MFKNAAFFGKSWPDICDPAYIKHQPLSKQTKQVAVVLVSVAKLIFSLWRTLPV